MKMVFDGKLAKPGQLNVIDRLSDLPDSILHHIISFLGSEESCRTTILSKRWTHIWSTGLILDFKPRFFNNEKDEVIVGKLRGLHKKKTIERLVNFTETTMRRYSEQNLSIRKILLDCPTRDQEMAGKIDGWLGIAVQNQVEALSLSIIPPTDLPFYELPAILFSAKSLVSMKCSRVRLPYCRILKLISLNSLDLSNVDLDECMLQNIIMSCPLKKLKLSNCSGFKNLLIPHCSRLELLDVTQSVSVDGKIVVDTSSFRCFKYLGDCKNDSWPFILKPASMKTLRELNISCVLFVNNSFDQFVSALAAIKKISFYDCLMPNDIRITSKTLKVLEIYECNGLIQVEIDSPVLDTFRYAGDLNLSFVTTSHEKCNVYLRILPDNLNTQAFDKIRKLLGTLNCCKVLNVLLDDNPQIEFDKEQLNLISDGIPYDVQELKLSLSEPIPVEFSRIPLMPLIDGLFWSCRPDILSLSITLEFDSTIVKKLLEILEEKVKCRKHPLKRIEREGPNCSSVSRTSWDLYLRLRLFW